MKLLEEKECCGCGSCVSACPFNAIKLTKSEDGFFASEINDNKCKNCGICIQKCPILKFKNQKSDNYKYFAAYSHNNEVLNKSSSGGIFYELASYFIKNGGIVFGAAFVTARKVEHIKVTNLKNLDSILKSKYLQSNAYCCFKEIKKLLVSNNKVLFSGTPCQIEALNIFLGKNYENLYTVDFICTGVPSQNVFDEYINYFENKYNDELVKIDFRNKKSGWYNYSIHLKFKNNEVYSSRFLNPLIYLQYNHISVMHKCLNCPFRNGNSSSDIQLGDLWNGYIINKKLYNKNGVSAVIIKTQKGNRLYKSVENTLCNVIISKNDLLRINKSYSSVVFDDKKRNSFFDEFNHSLNKYSVIKKYSHISLYNKIKIKKNLLILKIKGR